MKRSPLSRKPIKRKVGRLKKRARLRPVSKKRAAINRKAAIERKAFCEDVGACELCRTRTVDLLAHEIARGNRLAALTERAAQLVLCWECHRVIHAESILWCKPRQLALLRLRRKADFNLERYNAVATAIITLEEVNIVARILDDRLSSGRKQRRTA